MNLLKMVSQLFAGMALTMMFASLSSAACDGDRQTDWITNTSFYTNTDSVKANRPSYYVIEVTTPGTLELTFTDTDVNEDLTASLYTDGACGGAAVWSDTTSGVGTTISTSVSVVSAGFYTLQVYGSANGQATNYKVDGTFIASTTPPIMGAVPNQFFEIGVPFTFILVPYVTQTEGNAITAYEMTGLPSWATLDTATGIVTGTPDANGTHTITARAHDADGWSDPVTFLLDSTPLLAPVMGDVPDQDIIKDQGYSFGLSPYVTSSSSVTYHISGGSLPAGLTLDSATGIISGAATAVGTVTLQVYVEDTNGVASNTEDVTFAVTAAGIASDLDLLKISSTRLTEVGTTVTYSITIANTTSTVMTGVDITDVLRTYNYDLLTATVGTLVVPSPDVNITIIEDNTFNCTVTALDRIECTGGTIDKRSGPHGVPGLQRIYYSITTPLIPNPSYLLNTASVDGTTTDVNASVIAASGLGGYNPPTTPPVRADVIEGGIWTGAAGYNSGATQVIMTKVAGDNNVSLTAVHLDGESNATAYTPANSDQNFLVVPYISDGFCGSQEPLLQPDGTPARFYIPSGQTATNLVVKMPDYANRVRRIVVTYLDFDVIAPSAASSCVLNSSSSGNLGGLPQCINSEQKYYNTFGLEAYARCAANNGNPCASSNHGYSCGDGDTSCTGYNPAYDNVYGCLMCTLDIQPECSSDNFALRPDEYNITSSDNSYPDLLRSGTEYNLTINALNLLPADTAGYDQTGVNVSVDNVQKYYKDGTPEVAGHPMAGTGTLSNTFVFSNGVTTTPAHFSYTDVGDINIHLEDRDWAFVDISNTNDLTPEDCSDHGAYICGDKNATAIPDHFRVIVDLNNSNSAFTYLSNEQNMTASLNVKIYAENADNNTTLNFTMPAFGYTYYDNPVAIDLTVPTHPVMGAAVENEIATATLLDFDHGYKELTSEDTNTTLALWFHYARATNVPVNPFILHGNDVVVDVNSTYPATGTAVAPEGTAVITGTDSDDTNITYVYGRAHMARTRAMCSGGGNCNGNMIFYFEFYGDKDANKTLINSLLTTPQRSIDSVNWYQNTAHSTNTGDGNVTTSTDNIPGTVTYTPNGGTTSSAVYNYSGTSGYPYKGTIQVNSGTGTQSWLIYDKYNAAATAVRGQLEFYGPGKWSSSTTGAKTTVDDTKTNRQKNTNRRIKW